MATAAEFRRFLERLIAEVPVEVTRMQAEATADAFLDVVANSPVRFGYYRASHTIGEGDGPPRAFFYEHAERPPPQGPHPPRPVIPPPDVGAARASLERLRPWRRTVVHNAVRHAGFVEYGTALMAPRLVYERAASALAANLQSRIVALRSRIAARFR